MSATPGFTAERSLIMPQGVSVTKTCPDGTRVDCPWVCRWGWCYYDCAAAVCPGGDAGAPDAGAPAFVMR
jgi:hypothetical protein